jgi:hypothetical protein
MQRGPQLQRQSGDDFDADGMATADPAELISFRQRCDLAEPPFMHPADREVLERHSEYTDTKAKKDFEAFVKSSLFGDFNDQRFHLSLIPSPYVGDLRIADIFVLSLNPGLSFEDNYAEMCVPKFRERLEKTLIQDLRGVEFPFMFLDPDFCWHGGFRWWERKLRRVIKMIADNKFNGRYLDALRDISKRLASLELIPYHSASFGANSLIRRLPSAQEIKRFAQAALAQDAQQAVKTIVVIRRARDWDLHPKSINLVRYEGPAEAQAARLDPKSTGGKAILGRYGISTD